MFNNCNIIDAYIEDDLHEISTSSANNNVQDWFSGNVSAVTVNNNAYIPSPNLANAYWTPNFGFAHRDIQKIKNRGISNKNYIGTNDYITFSPSFKRYFGATNAQAVINWRLNSYDFPFFVTRGLFFWSRNVASDSISRNFTWDQLATHIPFYDGVNGPYIKLPEDRVMAKLSADTPVENNNVGQASDILGANYKFKNYRLFSAPFSNNSEIWIPEGDVFSYNDDIHIKTVEKSFISAPLYSAYNAIYHAITINRPKSIYRNTRESRRYKNLAKYLATSPYISDFDIDYMKRDEIQNLVYNHIEDKTSLELSLSYISKELNALNSSTDFNLNDENSGLSFDNKIDDSVNRKILKTPNEILQKLKNKYGVQLAISAGGSISLAKTPLPHGDNLAINHAFDLVTNNNFSFANNDNIIATQTISVGKYSISSVPDNSSVYGAYQRIATFSEQNQTNDIPTFEGILPQWNPRLNFNIVLKYDRTERQDDIDENNPNYWNPTYRQFVFVPPPTTDPNFPGTVFPGNSKISSDIPFPEVLSSEDLPDPDKVPVITLSAFYPVLSEEIFNSSIAELEAYDAITQASNDFRCVWSQVSGPPARFTDSNKSGLEKKLYVESTDDVVDVVFSDYGEITIKCEIFSPQGTYVKYKTFFLITEDQLTVEKEFNEDMTTSRKVVRFGDPDYPSHSFVFTDQMQPIPLNPRNLKVIAPSFNKVAFNANGIIWPVSTDFRVITTGFQDKDVMNLAGEKFIFQSSPAKNPNNKNNLGVSIKYDMPNSTKVYLHRITVEKVRDGTDECSDCLSLFSSNLIGYTRRAAGEGVTGNTLGYTNFFGGVSLYDIARQESVDFSMPEFSTDFGSKLHSYGSYNSVSNELETNLYQNMNLPQSNLIGTYSAITGFEFNYLADWRAAAGESSSGSGIDANQIPRHKLCYMQAHDVIENSYDDRESYIDFEKGAFIPDRGWVVDPTLNKSYVLKFNPGARDSFAFNGPKVNIQGNDVKLFGNSSPWGTQLVNSPSVFTSTVTLGIASGVQWDPLCECPPGQDESSKAAYRRRQLFQNTLNQLHKEYSDSDQSTSSIMTTGNSIPYTSVHGYRTLAGGNSRPIQRISENNYISNDEFSVGISEYSLRDYELKYDFAVTGPAKIPGDIDPSLKDYLTNPTELNDDIAASTLELRDPKINTAQIKDLEVNLRFLNYVNTQDLVVWLEVEMCELETKSRAPYTPTGKPPQYSSPIQAPQQFVDQVFPADMQYLMPLPNGGQWGGTAGTDQISTKINDSKLSDYLTALTKQNSNVPQENFRLILLNQEYVRNNEFNMNLKFSDHTENHIDANSYKNTLSFAAENGGQLRPSTAAMGYSEKYHAIYDKIIKENNLNITCNTFSKLHGTTLFMTPPPDRGPCPEGAPKQQGPGFDGKTKFMLKMATIDESDLMGPYDNLRNNVLAPNLVPDRNKIQSNNPFNNLCSWEIIVHTDSEIKQIPTSKDYVNYGSDSDILGCIDYQTKPNKKGHPGYSFLADLTGLTELLPLANINAPFNYIYDISTCISSSTDPFKQDEESIFPEIRWPDGAISNMIAATAQGALFSAGGGIVGAGIGSAMAVTSNAPIINYLNETRKWRGLDRKQGEVYNISHNGYELGSSDKILLNVSKDGAFWYTVEATMFRLANTPTIKTMIRKVLPISYADTTLNRLLSTFEYEILNSENILFEDFKDKIINDFYMSQNNIVNGMDAFNSNTYDENSNYTVIKIDNPIVFELYDINENMIFLYNNDTEITVPIVGKAKILIENKYCSIFIFDSSKDVIKESNTVKLNNNTIAIIEPITSPTNTLEDPEDNLGSADPLSQWKFNGDIEDESYDEQWSSAMSPIIQRYNFHSRGSYGDISGNLEKNYLHQLTKTNKIKKLYEIYNNRSNSKLKYNKILLYNKTIDDFSDIITSKTRAFGFSLDEFRGLQEVYDTREEEDEKFIVENNISKADFETLKENLNSKYRNKKYPNKQSQIIYVKNDDFIDIYDNNLWSQYDISVQGDLLINNKVNFYGDISDIEDRLNTLNGQIDETLVNDNDISSYVQFFKYYPSIQSALLYYSNILETIDSADYNKLNIISDHIQKLCVEKNALQKLLKQIADTDVKSHVTATLINADNNVNIYNVDYSINHNLYWINIDPKQSCGIAEELRPKVLTKTITTCSFLDPNLQGQEGSIDNNICYQSAYSRTPESGTIHNISFDDGIPIIDFRQTLPVVYEIPQETILKNKDELMKKYPSIADWKEQRIFRSFYMPITKQINQDYTQNYIVFVEEHYDVAVPAEHNLEVEDALKNFANDYSADVNRMAGISAGQPECTLGSPGGLGLLTELSAGSVSEDSATRNGHPTRVYNIFNLDDTNTLKVKFRKIPKILRGVDFLGTIYRYGVTSQYRQETLIQPLQPLQTTIGQGYLFNFPYLWKCYEYDENNFIQESSIPAILQMMNEITYRAYMGSADHVEHKDTYGIKTEFAHDMLPFEYYTKKDIEDQ